jgi:hypothetical protein
MFNFSVQILQNDKLVDTNFADYIANKKILVCPNINFIQKPTLKYFQYVDSLIDSHGLDEVLIIDSTKDVFFHKLVESYFPRFTSVGDSSQNYINALVKTRKNQIPVNKLIKHWIFQHLLHNGKHIAFWDQPTSNRWEHLLENKDAIQKLMKTGSWQRKILQKMFKNQQKTDIWESTCANLLAETPNGIGLIYGMGPQFFYFNLFHNKRLENELNRVNNNKQPYKEI